ncbi:MAG: cytochrome c [Sphingomonadales bacterium]|nr:cytochrome c [Sphingomonadales bacterium]MDE2169168.1 cytochrome c [Sphingomonadales bacterium]
MLFLSAAMFLLASGTPAQSPPPASAKLIAAPGVETLRRHCTLCHGAGMITARHMSARRWGALVDQMISRGAKVSDEDYKVIIAYLTQNYGPSR